MKDEYLSYDIGSMPTLHELPAAFLRQPYASDDIEPDAYGAGGQIVRTPDDPGYCYKLTNIPSPEHALKELTREELIHTVLVALGIPTIPTFELRAITTTRDGQQFTMPCIRMTDLAADGALVLSDLDFYHLEVGHGIQEPDAYRMVTGRPAHNADEFFSQLAGIVERASQASGTIAGINVHGVQIRAGGYLLVAHPNGTLETRVGDFHDGVEVYANETMSEHSGAPQNRGQFNFRNLSTYLNMVVRVFPALREPAERFMNQTFPAFLER